MQLCMQEGYLYEQCKKAFFYLSDEDVFFKIASKPLFQLHAYGNKDKWKFILIHWQN